MDRFSAQKGVSMIIKSAVLCEQCRPEIGNKWLIVGALGGDLIVPSFPSTFPIAIYFELAGLNLGHNTIDVEIHASGSDVQISGKVELDHPSALVVLPTPPGLNLTVDKPGELYATIAHDGNAPQEVLRRKIILGA